MAIMKLFIGYCRLQIETYTLIKYNIEAIIIEVGIPSFLYQIDSKYRYQTIIQIDHIEEILNKREIRISETILLWKSSNKMIIQLALEFIKENDHEVTYLYNINHIWLQKRLMLSIEVVESKGVKETTYFKNDLSTSAIQQKWKFITVPKPSNKQLKQWVEFKWWIKTKDIETEMDFIDQVEQSEEMSIDKLYYR